MVDTLNIRFDYSSEQFENIRHKLDRVWDLIEDGIIFSIQGTLKNLRINYNHGQVHIRGSLPKYHFGTNLRMISLEELKESIENILKIFNVKPQDVIVTEVHLACNILTSKSCTAVLSTLGEHAKKRKPESSGLYYSSSTEVLCIYDKAKERKRKGDCKVENLNEKERKNFLRIELQCKRIRKSIGSLPMTLEDILDEKYVTDLFNKAIKIFLEIDKKLIFVKAGETKKIIGTKALYKMIVDKALSDPQEKSFWINTINQQEYKKGSEAKAKNRMVLGLSKSGKYKAGYKSINPIADLEEKLKTIKPLINKTDSSGHPLNYYYL